MNHSAPRLVLTALLLLTGSLSLAPDAPAAELTSSLTLDPTGSVPAKLGYYPIRLKLLGDKPEGVKAEPAYRGTPKYAVFTVGNGPKARHYVALDEPADGPWRIYVDLNGDGNLTSSGDGSWSAKRDQPRPMYGLNHYVVRASYGTAQEETSSAGYGLAFYRFPDMEDLLMYREAAWVGTVTLDGKAHKALLAENDADGLFAKPLNDDGKPAAGGPATRPVWLNVDLEDKGKWSATLDVRSPFKLGQEAYVADVSPDGSRLTFSPTTRPVPKPPAPVEQRPLLAAGTPAPDFAAAAWGGGTVHLSDFKGKVVVLDFWATWCGPCQRSMPHIEQIYQATKAQDVVVLGLCVWDEKSAYEKWVPAKQDTYHFQFAFDPAGRNAAQGIAQDKYHVSGIPTTYLIDKEGKVAAAVVGYDEGDQRLEAALGQLGLTLAGKK